MSSPVTRLKSRKTERGAKPFPGRLLVRTAPFALLTKGVHV
jgi:hypothetical protein